MRSNIWSTNNIISTTKWKLDQASDQHITLFQQHKLKLDQTSDQ
jgi:hypothetical protein